MEQKTIIVGLTGQTGAGKSTVSALLSSRGYRVIDADLVARQVVEQGSQCLVDLVCEFGIEILEGDGTLNRRKLADIVFRDAAKRKVLNRIIFPYIQKEIVEVLEGCRQTGEPIVFLDAPTLIESGTHQFCDKVVSVLAPQQIRLKRLLARDADLSLEAIENRMSAQHDDTYYTTHSDFVIHNDGEESALRVQILEMLDLVLRAGDPK